jgi:ribosome-associated protein
VLGWKTGSPIRETPGNTGRSAGRITPKDSTELVELIARIADDKLAQDIVILDMDSVVGYTDYFLICSGNTPRQTQAISDEIEYRLKHDEGRLPHRGEGRQEGNWILLDYVDVVVHVFTPEARAFYRLEQLWGQVPSRAYASA